jgi:hypothetical protein
VAILRGLLDRHPQVRGEVEAIAKRKIALPAAMTIAERVHDALVSLPAEAVFERAGEHDGSYLDPSEAAWKVLAEALDGELSDMNRYMALGLIGAAEANCMGLVLGLHRAAAERGSGALGYEEDFPADYACEVVMNWLHAWPKGERKAALDRITEWLNNQVPEWAAEISRTANQAVSRR